MTEKIQLDEAVIPDELTSDVCSQLERNNIVRRKLPQWGRVHIDRQLPFLCIYRRALGRPDSGTEQLLLGEASYIMGLHDPKHQLGLLKLIREVIKTQSSAFGSFLVVEIWSGEDNKQSTELHDNNQQPVFRIIAPRHQVPNVLLEKMESALLGVSVDGVRAIVNVDYHDHWHPPLLDPLSTSSELAGLACTIIGLEVKPIYRNQATGEIFPFELRELRHELAHALKRTFYTFMHNYTSQRPAHYHALGRHAITKEVWEVDRRLADHSNRFDMLLHVTPVNVMTAWMEFEHQGYEQEPEFHYRPRPIDPAIFKRQLYEIPLEDIEDPTLAHIFSAKRDELDRQITMVSDRNTSRFLNGSLQVYGGVEDWLLEMAIELAQQLPANEKPLNELELMDARAFTDEVEKEIEHYKSCYPELSARVEVRNDISGIMVSKGNVLIGNDFLVPKEYFEATLSHEVGTHIVTYYNGLSQQFNLLQCGMANYEPLQEGLAVLSEYLIGKLSGSRLRLLAGRVLAVNNIIDGASFVDTFRYLNDTYDFSERHAFYITMRVYRGGGFTKDAVYLRGLVKLLDYFSKGGDLELLYLGKIALEHLNYIEELYWRKVLHTGPLRPRYLDSDGAQERLDRLSSGLLPLDLLI